MDLLSLRFPPFLLLIGIIHSIVFPETGCTAEYHAAPESVIK